jgi:molybdenum cofactor cytidylyltransferase
MRGPVGAAILAAGESRRLGQPKQLVPWRGTTVLSATIHEVSDASVERVAVVLGAHCERIAPTLRGEPIVTLFNPAWPQGMASSLRIAVQWATRERLAALAICVCDQLYLTASHLDALLARHARAGTAVASRYAGRLGVPAVFGASCFSQLAQLAGDAGAQRVLAALAADAIDWPDGELDLDTAADLAVARAVLEVGA